MAKVMENFIRQNFEAKILKQFSTVCYQPWRRGFKNSMFTGICFRFWLKTNLCKEQKKAPDFSGAGSFLSGKLIFFSFYL
jgi:hypothetical protein